MIYLFIAVSLFLLFFAGLIWLRKVQFDAIHRNFLDLVDHYEGRVIREGFAIRPKFSGTFQKAPVSISISSERKSGKNPRRFYISAYLQVPGRNNYTIMSREWLNPQDEKKMAERMVHPIIDDHYVIEVSEKKMFQKLNIAQIELIVKRLIPFAYILISRRGIIFERLSNNLIRDTEFLQLSGVVEGLYELSTIPARKSSPRPNQRNN